MGITVSQDQHPLYLTIHGHFYQPPRENPWTGRIEAQDSAAPDHDWNARIARQCYSPNAASRILSSHGRIVGMVNNYEYMSFNIGPTLMGWIRENTPDTYARIQDGDRKSAERLGGHGNAIAQVYNHMIMPLASPEDRRTQIRWGIQDFEFHFGRKPEGMWLAETAINMDTVVDLIREGIRFTVLSPTQAQSFRILGGSEWIGCENTDIDTTRAYRIIPRDSHGEMLCEGHLDVFFYNPWLSSAVGFEHLLRNADTFGSRIREAWDAERTEAQLVSVGTDGESYGHHEPFGDMCAAWLFSEYSPAHNMVPVNYGWYLEKFPPLHEVLLKNVHGEGCAWSCAHGVGRWYRDCGCSTGGGPDWNQKWRGPLRKAFDHLKQIADQVFVREFPALSNMDCWEARDHYIDVLVDIADPERRRQFVEAVRRPHAAAGDEAKILALLEIQKFCMFSYTSCGWFFNDIEGLEPVQNMRYALRAMELLKGFLPLAHPFESEMLAILAHAVSNERQMNGAEIFVKWARPDVPAAYKLMAGRAVELHLGLEIAEECVNADCRVAAEVEARSGLQTLVKATYHNPETYEEQKAGILVLTDHLGRVSIVVQPAEDHRHTLTFADSVELGTEQLQQIHATSYVVRMRDLLPDTLQHLNLLSARKNLKRLTDETQGFALRYGLSLDSLADTSDTLPDAMRHSLALSLNFEIQRMALECLYQIDEDLLQNAKLLVDEAKSLGLQLSMGGLGKLFHQRLASLIQRATGLYNPEAVRQITALITLADWLHLDIDKTSLENQAFEAYQAFRANPKGELGILRPMFEWLNFEHVITEV